MSISQVCSAAQSSVSPRLNYGFSILLTLFLFASATAAATLVVPGGGDLQAAINVAAPGDTIVLEAGATYRGPFLPNEDRRRLHHDPSSRAGEITGALLRRKVVSFPNCVPTSAAIRSSARPRRSSLQTDRARHFHVQRGRSRFRSRPARQLQSNRSFNHTAPSDIGPFVDPRVRHPECSARNQPEHHGYVDHKLLYFRDTCERDRHTGNMWLERAGRSDHQQLPRSGGRKHNVWRFAARHY